MTKAQQLMAKITIQRAVKQATMLPPRLRRRQFHSKSLIDKGKLPHSRGE